MKLTEGVEEVSCPKKGELRLPQTNDVDPEYVRLGPILAVRKRDIDYRQGRAVDIEGFVEA